MVHAGEIEGIDGRFARPVAGTAVIAMNQRRAVGGDSRIAAASPSTRSTLLRMQRHRCNDSA
jgi:hypothetical protein